MSERLYIPHFVFGRPAGEIGKVLEIAYIKACGQDAYRRAVELPAAPTEISSSGNVPDENMLVQRFIHYAQRTHRNSIDVPILCVAYRGGWKGFGRTLTELLEHLPFIEIHGVSSPIRKETDDDEDDEVEIRPESVNILLLENGEAVNQFQQDVPMLGTLLRSVSQGGILRTPKRGIWFVISHAPSIPYEELGRLLKATILSASPVLSDDDRHSVLPAAPVFTPPSSRKDSSPGVTRIDVSSGKQEPLSERIKGILNEGSPRNKDGS